MRTVVLGPHPPELAALIDRRRAFGQDLFDEVWEGEYHMNPAPRPVHGLVEDEVAAALRPYASAARLRGSGPFNLGEQADYRVPDRGYHRGRPSASFVPTAALVVEVVSPDDETYAKFGFYARHGVEELIVADPDERTVRIYARDAAGTGYDEVEASALLSVAAAVLTAALDWP